MNTITVHTTINAPIDKVWEYWNNPDHITKWAFASDDWEAPHAENDLKIDGKFITRMAAKDGSASFDFTGTYINIIPNELIEYSMSMDLMDSNGRKVSISFSKTEEGKTLVTETFDPENENSEDMQRAGWQAILDNFKRHVENV